MAHIMLDLETLDTVPGGAILSIGGVAFSLPWEDGSPAREAHFRDTVDLDSSCRDYGMTVSKDTCAWWMLQNQRARDGVMDSFEGRGAPLGDVLNRLTRWVDSVRGRGGDISVWGNGADFDNAFLAVAYRRVGLALPWKHKENRCFRTLKAMSGHLTYETPSSIPHDALSDAIAQADHLMRLLTVIKEKENLN